MAYGMRKSWELGDQGGFYEKYGNETPSLRTLVKEEHVSEIIIGKQIMKYYLYMYKVEIWGFWSQI